MNYLKKSFSVGVSNPRYKEIFGKKIVFDLDGVLRDLNEYLARKLKIPYPQKWFWKYKEKNMFDWIEQDDYRALVYSMPTKYYWVVKNLPKIEVWTCQPKKWRSYTEIWIGCNLPNAKVKYLIGEEKESELYSLSNTYLVEDSPNLKNYDKILLIDTPYNQHIKAKHRIKETKELKKWIDETT